MLRSEKWASFNKTFLELKGPLETNYGDRLKLFFLLLTFSFCFVSYTF